MNVQSSETGNLRSGYSSQQHVNYRPPPSLSHHQLQQRFAPTGLKSRSDDATVQDINYRSSNQDPQYYHQQLQRQQPSHGTTYYYLFLLHNHCIA